MLSWTGLPTIPASDYDDLACRYLTDTREESKPKTTVRRRTGLRAFARWAHIDTPGLDEYIGPTPAKAVPHPIPEGIDGIKRLLKVCDDPEEKVLVGLCGMAGLRVGEALKVCGHHIDVETMMLYVKGKGARDRNVPVQVELLAVLAPLMFDRADEPLVRMSDRAARRAITRAGRHAFLRRPISSHDLRATFATAVYDKTKDIRLVQELLGHASSETTEGYIGVREESMRAASDLFGEDAA